METLKLSANSFLHKNNIPFLGIVWFVLLLLAFPCRSQKLLHKVAGLDVHDDRVHNSYRDDSLLFVLRAETKNWNGFSLNIYSVADPVNPYEIGKQLKETYIGKPEFQNRVFHLKNSALRYPFYVVLSENKERVIHYFWYPNRVIESKGYYFEFRSFDPEVRIHQAASPTVVQLVKSYRLSISNAELTGLALVADVIYLTTRNAGLMLLDVADIDSINELPSPMTGGGFVGIIAGGNKVWLERDSSEIIELDVFDPRHPQITRSISGAGFHLVGFWQDNNLYLKEGKRITVLDDDLNPENSISFLEGVFIDSFIKSDSLLFVSATNGIEIYSLTRGNISHLSGISKSISRAFHFEKRDSLLLIADTAEGLTIVNVANICRPKLLSKYYLNGNARDVKVSGDYVYIADYTNGLVILNIRQPEEPELVSSLEIPDGAKSIDLIDNTVFLGANNWSLLAIDIANKKMPRILHQHIINAAYPWDESWIDDNVVCTGNHIWCYFYDSPLFVYKYDSTNGFIQKAQFGAEPTGWGWGNEINAYDNLMYFATATGIRIIDMDMLSFVIGKSGFAGGALSETQPLSVAKQGDTLLVSMGYMGGGGIEVYDMKDPSHPIKLEENLPSYYLFQEIIFENDYLYMLTPTGIEIVSLETTVMIDEKDHINSSAPGEFYLSQNYPNPFNATTVINYVLPESGLVSLDIYSSVGQKVRTLFHGFNNGGAYQLSWNGRNDDYRSVSSGIYFYKLKVLTKNGSSTQTRKLLLVR